MTRRPLERLLRLVAQTEDQELDCSACFDLLPLCVDFEVSGGTPDVCLPLFRRHLVQCRVCREEYEVVRALARLEAVGHLPQTDGLR